MLPTATSPTPRRLPAPSAARLSRAAGEGRRAHSLRCHARAARHDLGGGLLERAPVVTTAAPSLPIAPSSLDERLGVSAQIPALPDRERFMTDVGWSVFVAPTGSVAVVGLVPQTPDSPPTGSSCRRCTP